MRKLTSSLVVLMAALLLCGASKDVKDCDELVIFWYLLEGPVIVEPPFDKETGESLADKDVRVCVVCSAPDQIKRNFSDIEFALAQTVSFQLHRNKIRVVPPEIVKDWLEENKDGRKPKQILEAFRTTHLIQIDLDEFSLNEEGNSNLYRGCAEAIVTVWRMDEESHVAKIFSAEKVSRYPMQQPVRSSEKSNSPFKSQYLTRLSDEIGRLFYEYNTADEIAPNQN